MRKIFEALRPKKRRHLLAPSTLAEMKRLRYLRGRRMRENKIPFSLQSSKALSWPPGQSHGALIAPPCHSYRSRDSRHTRGSSKTLTTCIMKKDLQHKQCASGAPQLVIVFTTQAEVLDPLRPLPSSFS